VGPAENRGRGRPPRLTPELREALLARLAAGDGFAEAASAVRVSARTLRAWRQRAWSSRPEDRAYVELERRVQHVLGASRAVDWETAASRLVANAAWSAGFEDEYADLLMDR
jgi:transposase-like protein